MNAVRQFEPKGAFPSLPYILTAPEDWDPATERLPMLVFLHGAGERGTDPAPLRSFYGIPRLFGEQPQYHGLRVITLSPQCPESHIWHHLTLPLRELIETVAEECGVDRDRITITGCSMGGFGTWEMICTYPQLFAAAAPICGGGLTWRAGALKQMPLRVFHGGADSVVPLVYSQLMTDAVNKAGGHAELTVFPGVDHDSWIPTYRDTDVIEWLVAQKRSV